MLEGPALTRAFGGEQGQLAAPRVGADERERVGPVDHVHSEVPHREVGHGIAVREPVGDVVEREGPHVVGSYSIGSLWTSFSSAYFCVSSFTTGMPLSYA